VFAALAHPIRRAILEHLSDREATIVELAEPFDVSLPAISRHIRVLSDAGLIACEKQGRDRHCRLHEDPLVEALQWIVSYGRFWEARLDSLAAFLSRSPPPEAK
jgi:DNA-binding transcriptional ArsR family regulator